MSSHDEEMRMLKQMELLRVAMDRGTATPEDEQEYDALRDAVEARLKVTPAGPQPRPAGTHDTRDAAA